MSFKVTSTPYFLILVITLAISKWWTFKLLKWVQINPLITFEPFCGFG
jgi:hypothetical protein